MLCLFSIAVLWLNYDVAWHQLESRLVDTKALILRDVQVSTVATKRKMKYMCYCNVQLMIRLPMLNETQLVWSEFYDFTMEQQFNLIFACKDLFRCTAKTCFNIINYRRKGLYVA
jgi:hypothetical protein